MVKQIVLQMLDNIKNVVNDCSDEELLLHTSKLNADALGYIKDDELLNYDQAMKMLGIANRNTFNNLCKIHKIPNVKIKNVHVGFKKKDIECLLLKIKTKN